jgi:hypothetical protein
MAWEGKMDCGIETIEVLPSGEPTVITMEVDDIDIELALYTHGESLRGRLMLALIESLVFDVPRKG